MKNDTNNLKTKKKIEFPHVLVLIFTLIALVSFATRFIPAGQYDRITDTVTGRIVVDPSSYHVIERTPTTLLGIFTAIPKGMGESAWIMFLIILIGGSFKVIMSTGALQAFLGKTVKKASKMGIIFIPLLILVFGLMASFMSNIETYIAFVPLAILLAKALGFDALVGVTIVLMGVNIGFSAGMFNPFSTGIAQNIIGLPQFSGLGFRFLSFFVFYGILVFFTVRYAQKVKSDPTKSLMYDAEHCDDEMEEFPEFTGRLKFVLFVITLGFAGIIYALASNANFKTDIPALFMIIAILTGIAAGHSPNQIAKDFVAGCHDMLLGALVVGFARAMSVVMTEACIIDTIVHSTTGVLSLFPKTISAVLMYFMQIIINCFLISASGQAATTIPIMSPIADVLGFTQQTVVLAFQFGDGLINQLLPTSGTTMAILALAGISYPKWFKYIGKVMLANLIAAGVLVGIAASINLGPF
ncbi:MAG: YfcC family protein [Oscillospiraceae bacterium]